jgi:hypothetical protein
LHLDRRRSVPRGRLRVRPQASASPARPIRSGLKCRMDGGGRRVLVRRQRRLRGEAHRVRRIYDSSL